MDDLEGWKDGRAEDWRSEAFQRLNVSRLDCWAGELFSVHDGDPPFFGNGDDGEALTVAEQMFGLQS